MADTGQNSSQRIVVEVDGSLSSLAALRWAVRQAELTGAAVDAVTAWRFPAGYEWVPDDGTAAVALEAAARRLLTEAVDEVREAGHSVEIRTTLAAGHPASVLVDAARGADLLVVGSRGHGGFAGALLGSVSSYCVHHARCPVLVMRGDRSVTRPDDEPRGRPHAAAPSDPDPLDHPRPHGEAAEHDAPRPPHSRGDQPSDVSDPHRSLDFDDLDAVSSLELHHLAVRRAIHWADLGFFWELLRAIPATESIEGHDGVAAMEMTRVSALIADALQQGRNGLADALRPLYIDYLTRNGHGPPASPRPSD